MKKYALVVGVEEYRDSGFSSLPYARADAIALAERLRDRCQFDHVRLLADESGLDEPLLVNIVTGLRDISSDLQPEDLFLFFFAGHGMERDGHGYLLARDSLHVYPEHASLSLELLRKTFAYLAAGRRIVLMDACRNCPEVGRDEVDNTMGDGIARDIAAAAQSQWETPAMTALFTACRSGQRAFEWPAKGHGVFTQCLLDGLDGGAWSEGRLEFSDLARHTIAGVRTWMTRTPGRTGVQEPWYEQFGEPGPIYLAEAIDPEPATSPPPRRPGRVEFLKDPVLRVETTPAGAAVKVDGKVRGKTPVDLTLNAGEYRVRFELEGYHPIEQRIRYDAAGDALLEISLKERPRITPAFFPMTSEEAKEVQAVTAEALGLGLEITNSIGMKLRLIPPGEFMMGSSVSAAEIHRRFPGGQLAWYEDEHPRHTVRITRAYYLGAHAVTVSQFEQFVRATGYQTTAEKEGNSRGYQDGLWKVVKGMSWRKPGFAQASDHPVTCVSWEDATAFCKWVSQEDGQTYRLPSEAEWEYACRAGTETLFFWGDDPDGGEGYLNAADLTGAPGGRQWKYTFNFKSGYTATSPVGHFKPNGFGVYDMLGNVWEWCSDWYGRDYYANSPLEDPTGPESGSFRVYRGGSWRPSARRCRSAFRHRFTPGRRDDNLGFRLAFSSVGSPGG